MPGAKAVAADAAYEGKFRLAATTDTRSLWIGRYDDEVAGRPALRHRTRHRGVAGHDQHRAVGGVGRLLRPEPHVRGDPAGQRPDLPGPGRDRADRGTARLLVAPESPDGQTGRFKGCCPCSAGPTATTVLFQSVGTHGPWVLAWDVRSSEVFKVMRIKGDAGRRRPSRGSPSTSAGATERLLTDVMVGP